MSYFSGAGEDTGNLYENCDYTYDSIKGDEKAIRSLITILLDNAVKYTNERGRIDVTLGKKKNRIYLSVFNTTEYISKEQTSRYLIVFIGQIFPEIPRQEDTDLDFL